MTTTNGLLHLMIYSLVWLFSLDTVIAPSLQELIVAHDSSEAIDETHHAAAVKSTIGLSGERLSYLQPCRQDLEDCVPSISQELPEVGSSAATGAGESADGYDDTRSFAQHISWKVSIVRKMRQMEGKLLFSFYPELKDNWNLVQAGYEEVLAGFMRSWRWSKDEALAATLADMRTARQRSTTLLGLSPKVRQYISKKRLPELYRNLATVLDQAMDHMSERARGGADIESRIFILNKLFEAELQDPALLPYLKPLQIKLNNLNQQHPSLSIPWELGVLAVIPPRPSFSDWNRLRQPPPQLQKPHRIWRFIDYQFRLEEDHLTYVRMLGTPVLSEWAPVEKLTREFRTSTRQSAWVGSTFYPEKFTVAQYKILQKINLERRALIKAAARAAQDVDDTHGSGEFEVDLLRNIQFEALAIEGASEHSDEVMHVLKRFARIRGPDAEHYIRLLGMSRSHTLAIPADTDTLDLMRQLRGMPRHLQGVSVPGKTVSSLPAEELTITNFLKAANLKGQK